MPHRSTNPSRQVLLVYDPTLRSGMLTRESVLASQLSDELSKRGIACRHAQENVEVLGENGPLPPFFRELLKREIEVLVVIATSRAAIRSKWVKKVWREYLASGSRWPDQREVVCVREGTWPLSLPPELRPSQSFRITGPDLAPLIDGIEMAFRYGSDRSRRPKSPSPCDDTADLFRRTAGRAIREIPDAPSSGSMEASASPAPEIRRLAAQRQDIDLRLLKLQEQLLGIEEELKTNLTLLDNERQRHEAAFSKLKMNRGELSQRRKLVSTQIIMLRSQADGLAAEIARAARPPETPDRPKRPRGPIFISHSSSDLAHCERLVREIESAGFPCWHAKRDLMPGKSGYHEGILDAIGRSWLVLVLVSSSAVESAHVKNELEEATNLRKPFLPLHLEGFDGELKDVRYFLKRFQAIPMPTTSERIVKAIEELASREPDQ